MKKVKTRKTKEEIKKEVDKIQEGFEKKQRRDTQKEYKTKTPAFIWILKILLVIAIIQGLISMIIVMRNL